MSTKKREQIRNPELRALLDSRTGKHWTAAVLDYLRAA